MIRTFLDSNVLIDAARGTSPQAERARSFLIEADREFVSSFFIQMEILPKAVYFQRASEIKFYQFFFDSVVGWFHPNEYALSEALSLAQRFGLGALDALHLTAARMLKVDEFITGEKRGSPLFRPGGIKIVSLYD